MPVHGRIRLVLEGADRCEGGLPSGGHNLFLTKELQLEKGRRWVGLGCVFLGAGEAPGQIDRFYLER